MTGVASRPPAVCVCASGARREACRLIPRTPAHDGACELPSPWPCERRHRRDRLGCPWSSRADERRASEARARATRRASSCAGEPALCVGSAPLPNLRSLPPLPRSARPEKSVTRRVALPRVGKKVTAHRACFTAARSRSRPWRRRLSARPSARARCRAIRCLSSPAAASAHGCS